MVQSKPLEVVLQRANNLMSAFGGKADMAIALRNVRL